MLEGSFSCYHPLELRVNANVYAPWQARMLARLYTRENGFTSGHSYTLFAKSPYNSPTPDAITIYLLRYFNAVSSSPYRNELERTHCTF